MCAPGARRGQTQAANKAGEAFIHVFFYRYIWSNDNRALASLWVRSAVAASLTAAQKHGEAAENKETCFRQMGAELKFGTLQVFF